MTSFEIFILMVFAVFIGWVMIRPQGVLELQKKIYAVMGIQMEYNENAVLVIRVIAGLVVVLGIFGMISTIG